MLPVTYFERISSAYQLKTFNSIRERRQGIRVDVRSRGYMCQLSQKAGGGMCVSAPAPIRVREMSCTGASLLHCQRMRVGQEFLLRIDGRDGVKYWQWVRCRRCAALDGLTFLTGLVFLRILYPGQDLSVGSDALSLLWLDVEGSATPEDPFAGDARAA